MHSFRAIGIVATLALATSGCGSAPGGQAGQPNSITMQSLPPELNNIKHKESMIVHHEGRVKGLSTNDKSQYMAEALAAMAGIHTADVLLLGDEAYVAVTLQDTSSSGMSRFLKGAIKEKIKSMDDSLRGIHVTEQPELAGRLQQLRLQMNQGVPVEQQLSEFVNIFKGTP